MVLYAKEQGVKPAARKFKTSPQTVRQWLKRYEVEGLSGLKERSHRARRQHPQTTPPVLEAQIVAMRNEHPEFGQDRIAELLRRQGVHISGKTVGKLLHKHKLIAPPRTSRRISASSLLKGRLKPFEKVQFDVKDLLGACDCVEQIVRGVLPRYEFTLRDVATGASFVAYGKTLSAHNVLCFAHKILMHLGRYELKPRVAYSYDESAWIRHKLDKELVDFWHSRGVVPGLLQTEASNFSWSVASFHNLMRREFYGVMSFNDENDLLNKAWDFEC